MRSAASSASARATYTASRREVLARPPRRGRRSGGPPAARPRVVVVPAPARRRRRRAPWRGRTRRRSPRVPAVADGRAESANGTPQPARSPGAAGHLLEARPGRVIGRPGERVLLGGTDRPPRCPASARGALQPRMCQEVAAGEPSPVNSTTPVPLVPTRGYVIIRVVRRALPSPSLRTGPPVPSFATPSESSPARPARATGADHGSEA